MPPKKLILVFAYSYQDTQYFLQSAEAIGHWGTLSWTYDRIGNRLTEDRDGTVDSYTYQPNTPGNTPILASVALGVGGTRDYTFDVGGSLDLVTAGANVIDFSPDDEQRLSALVRGAENATFTYDGRSFLSRVERAAGAEFTEPTYSSDGLLLSLTRQGPTPAPLETVDYFYFAGRPVTQLKDDGTASTWTFLTTDHLGTPLLATDLMANEVWRGPFEPFGRDVNQAAPNSARGQGIFLGFPGQWDDGRWQDASAGADLYYNVHRWYEFGTGRYGRSDPLSELQKGSFDPFIYARSSPAVFVDPLGLISCDCLDDCPSGEWEFSGGGGSLAVVGGLGHTRGTFRCVGRQRVSVPVKANCGMVGPILAIGIGIESSVPTIPASCGCNAEDVLGEQASVIGSFLPFSISVGGCSRGPLSISPRTVTLGLGKSFGAGLAGMKCNFKLNGPISFIE